MMGPPHLLIVIDQKLKKLQKWWGPSWWERVFLIVIDQERKETTEKGEDPYDGTPYLLMVVDQ